MCGAYGASAERRDCSVGVQGEQWCLRPLLRPGGPGGGGGCMNTACEVIRVNSTSELPGGRVENSDWLRDNEPMGFPQGKGQGDVCAGIHLPFVYPSPSEQNNTFVSTYVSRFPYCPLRELVILVNASN